MLGPFWFLVASLVVEMVRCCDPSCSNDSRTPGCKNLSFHSFPKDPKLLKVWLTKVGRGRDFDPANKRLCSAHFEDQCFEPCLRAELVADGLLPPEKRRVARRLKADAIPTIFWHRSEATSDRRKGKRRLSTYLSKRAHAEVSRASQRPRSGRQRESLTLTPFFFLLQFD